MYYIPHERVANEVPKTGSQTGQVTYVESDALEYKMKAFASISELYRAGSPPAVIMSYTHIILGKIHT